MQPQLVQAPVKMAADEFNLKWDDHKNNIVRSIKEMREDEDFYDVTLVGDDHQQVSAHKVILSTCSQYFKKVLKQNKHPFPLLCLWGLNHSDLKNILELFFNIHDPTTLNRQGADVGSQYRSVIFCCNSVAYLRLSHSSEGNK